METLWFHGKKTKIIPLWRPTVGSMCSEKFLSQITPALFTSWIVNVGDYLGPVLTSQVSGFVTWGRMFILFQSALSTIKMGIIIFVVRTEQNKCINELVQTLFSLNLRSLILLFEKSPDFN